MARVDVEAMQQRLQKFGNAVRRIRFNALTLNDTSRPGCFVKTRLHHAAMLVPLANWYAARLGIRMRVLARSVWIWYEPLMYDLLLGSSVSVTGSTLLLPRVPGHTLGALLRKKDQQDGRLELALSLAVTELGRLHTCWTPHPWHGRLQLFSHADASIENVLVDTTRRRARWIDFETTHEPTLPAATRHADDLLTLLCDLVAVVEPEQLRHLFPVLLRSYPSRPVTEAMVDLIDLWAKHPLARKVAIPLMTDDQWQLLQNAKLDCKAN